MRRHAIATATMVVLAVGGWAALGSGTAFAETGSDGAKARASGGSSTGEDVFQQNTAQSSRQNNNCHHPNAGVDGDEVALTGGRATGRCVTSDGSLTAFSRFHNGPAEAEGGSTSLGLVQQNTAQRGRQNNNCHNPNASPVTVDSGRVDSRCTDQDFSFSKHTLVKGGGARAEGGSTPGGESFQQNVAQAGRQNNNCNHPNLSTINVSG
ncbi:hypothetical protein, partial [Streptomyces sp. NPDC051776]|uniref:hypothetical protein n=1 Tax=Streptomyces sp. NPDC051776 TaxID=3155414 RepID=UPI003429B32D